MSTNDIKMVPIPKGALFTITSGEYSDYGIHGVFRALEEIDADALRAEWLVAHPEQASHYHFREDEFLASLAKRNLMEPVDCWEWHISDYSCANEMQVTQMDHTTP